MRLNGTRQPIHDVVDTAMCVSNGATAPDPSTAACRSGMPHTTGAPPATPSSDATSGSSGPSTEPVAMSSGSRPRSRRDLVRSSSTYPNGAPMRLSVSHEAIMDAGVAAARPVKRSPR